jgi:membrane protein YqaA with SNARE-associated domain
MKRIIELSKKIPKQAFRPWAPYALAIVALSDYFIFIIPLDAVVIATITAAPKRWFAFSFWTTLGSTIGVGIFAELIRIFGHPFIDRWGGNLLESSFAHTFQHWLQNYGFWALIGSAILPIAQHPGVAIAALAKVSTTTIVVSMFIGRFFKYAIYAWLVTHAKRGLRRFFIDK